ncbi:Dynein assembly factor 3 [Phytophthora nicotianae]|uniref:Dynein assembly factor 3 n=1 Tax=Phytophthora nicotianae TaxID=4792 RepID=A0A0W8BXI4_PHYNI|nr:Dynein assembly factor 3 [Phytophthora nicotianae]
MWGFSPAYDVCSGLSEWNKGKSSWVNSDDDEQKVSNQPINVLLAGPGDVRHVLATISCRRRWEPAMKHRPVHIYIFEKAIETLSRDLLLVQVAFDTNLPLRQRCNLFLEIFGNSRVQVRTYGYQGQTPLTIDRFTTCFFKYWYVKERTSVYIEEQAKLLIDFVYNDRGSLAGLVDLSHLKMRTHDDLIDSFRSWFQSVKFNVDTLLDHRLRHYYEVRYDYRDNLIDWDYTMKLKKIENASVIHIRQYRDWRNTGVAFEFGDQTYTVPNRTMAAYTEAKKKHHGSVLCRGLWTDIIVSPYISFGVHCEKPNRFVEQLFEIHNKGTGVEQNRHNTVEVAVYNVLSYLYEIETGKRYQMGKEHDIFSGIGDAEGTPSDDKLVPRFEELNEDTDQSKITEKHAEFALSCALIYTNRCALSPPGNFIIPLTGNVEDLFSKKRYTGLFDYAFISSQQCHTLQPSEDVKQQTTATITNILKDGAAVDVESSVFMLPLTEEQRALYVTKLQEWAAHHALQPTFDFHDKNEPSHEDMTKINNAVLRFSYGAKGASAV